MTDLHPNSFEIDVLKYVTLGVGAAVHWIKPWFGMPALHVKMLTVSPSYPLLIQLPCT